MQAFLTNLNPLPPLANFRVTLTNLDWRFFGRVLARTSAVVFPAMCFAIPMIPKYPIFETTFSGFDMNLNIGIHQGVKIIHWHMWRACFFGDKEQGLLGCIYGDFVVYPYIFIIQLGNFHTHVTTQRAWIAVLFAHFVCWMLLLVTVAYRVSIRGIYSVPGMTWGGRIRRDYWVVKIYLGLWALVILFLFITAVGGSLVLQSMKTNLQILGTGGTATVDTKPMGFIYTACYCCVIFLFFLNELRNSWMEMWSFNKIIKKEEKFRKEAGTYKIDVKGIQEYNHSKATKSAINYFARTNLLDDLN